MCCTVLETKNAELYILGEGWGSEKVYVLHTCEDTDNQKQPHLYMCTHNCFFSLTCWIPWKEMENLEHLLIHCSDLAQLFDLLYHLFIFCDFYILVGYF